MLIHYRGNARESINPALARGQRCKPVAGENLPRGLAAEKVLKPRCLGASPDRQRQRIRDGWVTVFGKDPDHAHALLGLRVRPVLDAKRRLAARYIRARGEAPLGIVYRT